MTMLKTPLAKMLRTTKQKLELLSKLGLFTVRDLLLYYPRAYEDKSVLSSISMFSVKHVNTSRGTLSPITKMTTKYGKKILKATFTDEQGASVECVWFGQFHLPQIWNRPKKVLVSGKVRWAMGKMTLQSPEVEEDTGDLLHAGGIIAVYHETEGISSKWLREKISTLVHACSEFEDILPLEISTEFGFPTKGDSLRAVHFPESDEQLDLARKMLSFEELYILQLQALRQKHLWEEQGAAAGVVMDSDLMKEFQSTLPFELTGAQKVSLFEILTDMASGKPMLRMLQGDVGSGKTIVAAMAILNASRQGYQCCVMSPTEILTKQHFQTMKTILPDCRIELLVGSMKESEKQEVRDSIAAGDVDLVIGTHALIQSSVQFRNLGLGVIDEQHRFGVEQRKRLAERSGTCVPHLLMMSATPIPRSLALTIYGDQDLSIIDEMPKGRKPIVTKVVHPGARYQSTLFIDDQISKGQQVFVVCPLIEESEKLEEVKNVLSEVQRLRDEVFVHRKVTFIHGKMKSEEKDTIMMDFKRGDYDILVATSVVEVGIDVPNASIMLIEGAERFGLSQLHQFRGRVGRGADQSYCFLFTSKDEQRYSRRLKAMQQHTDGFKLAEIDLQIRGPGELYGIKQSGIPDLKMASIMDGRTIALARKKAGEMLGKDPDLSGHPELEKMTEMKSDFLRV